MISVISITTIYVVNCSHLLTNLFRYLLLRLYFIQEAFTGSLGCVMSHAFCLITR